MCAMIRPHYQHDMRHAGMLQECCDHAVYMLLIVGMLIRVGMLMSVGMLVAGGMLITVGKMWTSCRQAGLTRVSKS